MAQKDNAQLNSEINAGITDPENEQITAAIVRGILGDIADSSLNKTDGGTVTGEIATSSLLTDHINTGGVLYIDFPIGEGDVFITSIGDYHNANLYVGHIGFDIITGTTALIATVNSTDISSSSLYTNFITANDSINSPVGTFGDLIATNFSANTLYSGTTNLYDIFSTGGGNIYLPTQQVAFGNALSGVTGSTTLLYNDYYLTFKDNLLIGKLGAGEAFIQGYLSNFAIYGHSSTSITKFWTDGTITSSNYGWFNKSLLTSYSISSTTISGSVIQSDSMIGISNRMVEASTGGTLSATKVIVSAYITDSTIQTYLEDVNNWDYAGSYTGSTISGTYQGQKHYNANYFFEAVADDLFIRLIRG